MSIESQPTFWRNMSPLWVTVNLLSHNLNLNCWYLTSGWVHQHYDLSSIVIHINPCLVHSQQGCRTVPTGFNKLVCLSAWNSSETAQLIFKSCLRWLSTRPIERNAGILPDSTKLSVTFPHLLRPPASQIQLQHLLSWHHLDTAYWSAASLY